MLSIRLRRMGKNKTPSYRVIVTQKSRDPWGTYIEEIGFYNPLSTPKVIQFNTERVLHWISQGAQATPTIHNLLVDQKIIKGPKVSATNTKKPKKDK